MIALLLTTITHVKKVTTTTYDTIDVIKTALPVVLFFAGLAFNRILENIKENKRLKEIKLYFYLLTDYLYTSIEVQRDVLMKEARVLKEFKSVKISIDEVPMFRTEHIKRINQADLFKIFIDRMDGDSSNNIKYYVRIQSVLDFIDTIKPNIEKQSKDIVDYSQKTNEEINSSMRAILEFYNERKIELSEDPYALENDDLMNIMTPLLAKIKGKTLTMGLDEVHRVFYLPLMAYLGKQELPKDILPLATYVSDGISSHRRLVAFRTYHIQDLIKKARNLNRSGMQLRKAVQHFKRAKEGGMMLKASKL